MISNSRKYVLLEKLADSELSGIEDVYDKTPIRAGFNKRSDKQRLKEILMIAGIAAGGTAAGHLAGEGVKALALKKLSAETLKKPAVKIGLSALTPLVAVGLGATAFLKASDMQKRLEKIRS
jgi:hypothetical protein